MWHGVTVERAVPQEFTVLSAKRESGTERSPRYRIQSLTRGGTTVSVDRRFLPPALERQRSKGYAGTNTPNSGNTSVNGHVPRHSRNYRSEQQLGFESCVAKGCQNGSGSEATCRALLNGNCPSVSDRPRRKYPIRAGKGCLTCGNDVSRVFKHSRPVRLTYQRLAEGGRGSAKRDRTRAVRCNALQRLASQRPLRCRPPPAQ
jgi:hypothetical protein